MHFNLLTFAFPVLWTEHYLNVSYLKEKKLSFLIQAWSPFCTFSPPSQFHICFLCLTEILFFGNLESLPVITTVTVIHLAHGLTIATSLWAYILPPLQLKLPFAVTLKSLCYLHQLSTPLWCLLPIPNPSFLYFPVFSLLSFNNLPFPCKVFILAEHIRTGM